MTGTTSDSSTGSIELVVRVGFTGHRRLWGPDGSDPDPKEDAALRAHLKAAVRDALNDVIEAARATAASSNGVFDPEPRVELLTGLASGADQVAAEACFEAGCVLVPVSPFSWSEFERDFENDPEGRATLLELLERAPGSGVELAADRERTGTLEERFRQGRDDYASLGGFLLAQSDILLAFLDERRVGGGIGGTAAVVADADLRRLPCWILSPDGDEVRGAGRRRPGLLGSAGAAASPHDLVKETLALPEDHDAHGHASGHTNHHPRDRTDLVEDYLAETLPSSRPWYRRVFAPLFDQLVKRLGGAPSDNDGDLEPLGNFDPGSDLSSETLRAHYEWADRLAGHCNGVHRTTLLSIYVLGFFAVLSAVVGELLEKGHIARCFTAACEALAAGDPAAATNLAHHHPLAYFVSLAEITFLAGILALFYVSRRWRIRAKGTDYRLLAELLRIADALWPLRTRQRPLEPRAQGSDGSVQGTWMYWYAQAIVRHAGPLDRRFDRAYRLECRAALRHYVADQRRFHQIRVHRFHRLETFFEAAVIVLFALAFLGALGHLFHIPGLASYALVMTAGLPALAAAIHGLLTQAEFARLERRYESMQIYLDRVLSEIGRNDAQPDDGGPIQSRDDLVATALEVTSRMVDEVAEWRWLHAVHDARIG